MTFKTTCVLTLCFLTAAAAPLAAQTPGEAPDSSAEHDVMATIERLFDGMRAGDSTMVRSAFHPSARMSSTGIREGQLVFSPGPVDPFVNAVGTPHDAMWDERIFDVKVHVDGPLASAWTPYVFFAGDQLSHCGVNTFQLVREGERDWKIAFLADTRQRECSHITAEKMEESAVKAAVRHYLRGHATGDGSHHEMVFHPESRLFWITDGQLNQRTSADYIAGAPGQPADDEARRKRYIEMVDITGDAAVAKVVLDYPGAYIVDYMSPLKVDGRWQIVNKAFTVDRR
jgi:hypothetical protein